MFSAIIFFGFETAQTFSFIKRLVNDKQSQWVDYMFIHHKEKKQDQKATEIEMDVQKSIGN